MSFRTRLFLAFLLAVLLPLALLFWRLRIETTDRLSAEYTQREEALTAVVRNDLADRSREVEERLGALAADLADENRFRLAAIVSQPEERRWLLDWAGQAMQLAGLSVLRLEDSSGRILSSGQFRNEFDRSDLALPRAIGGAPGGLVLARVPTAETPRLALVRMDSLRVAGRSFLVIGGVPLDSTALAQLSPDPDLAVRLALPGATDDWSPADAIGTFPLPFVDGLVDPDRVGTARVVVLRTGNALPGLLASMDRWFAVAGLVTVLLALLLAAVLSARVSHPLTDLAERTATLDLDRLDQSFPVERNDEIGRLAGVLTALTTRLRTSATRLREVERRATVGDVARQVNHDVKNGLAPIRHVLRHLGQVARDDPEQLATVYREREGTLESSVAYLEQLARNYARLTPRLDRELCDLNTVAREATAGAPVGAALDLELSDNLPPVRADAVVLRRILENLLGNAFDAVDGGGRVLLATEPGNGGPPAVKLIVADTGRGMTSEELERAFDDFYTTKPGGTGLGLSVVRRLVTDLGGVLRVRTEPGVGTRFEIELPAERGAV